MAIVQYLPDPRPDRQLLAPTGSLARYQTLEWLNFISADLHKSFSPLLRDTTPDDDKALLRQQLEQTLSWVNQPLNDKQWLPGIRFTVADASLFTVMCWAKGVNLDLNGLAELDAWLQRVAARPSAVNAVSTASY